MGSGPRLADRCRETSTTTGSGTLSLAGAVSNYRTIVTGIGTTNTCFYTIVHQTVAEWECGIGTSTSGTPDTLSRTTVLASSNSNAAVTLSAGTKDVFVDFPAAAFTYQNPTATYATLVAYAQGRILFPSDGMALYRDTGTALAPWGPIYPFTLPVSTDFAWINQGGASVQQTYGGVYLLAPDSTSTDHWRIRKKSAPATPYTITAYIEFPFFTQQSGGFGVGLCFRQSSDGKLAIFMVQNDQCGVRKYADGDTFSASYVFAQGYYAKWFRIADDGASRICSMSSDGQNWIVIHTVGRTDYLTADEVGFCANAVSGGKLPLNLGITLMSWKEA